MSRYIDADVLYEQTAEWEAQAMAQVERLSSKPFVEMDEHEKAEWDRWTAILGERSAFKFDVADAPTADVKENVHAHWVIERGKMPNGDIAVGQFCSDCGYPQYLTTRFCPNCGARMERDK